MRAQLLGIGVSLMVHGVAAMLIFGVSQQFTPTIKTLYIDFSLDSGSQSGKGGSGGRNEEAAPLSGVAESPPVFSDKRPPDISGPQPASEKGPPVDRKASPRNSVARDNATTAVRKASTAKRVPSKPVIPKKTIETVREKKIKPNPPVQAVKEALLPAQEDDRHSRSSPLSKKITDIISDYYDDFQGCDRISVAEGFAEFKMARVGGLPEGSDDQAGSGRQGETQLGGKNSGIPQGEGGSAYLNANFNFIRGHLEECLYYPSIARKRGWSGKVMVAFTIHPDGRAENIEIKESCGNSLLDKSALKTVRNACPFPKPPMTARIVIPILYQLN